MSGTARSGPRAARRPRRAGRDGDRLPAVRARHPARARSVHGHREVRRGGDEHDATTLTPLFEGGNYFECPRWHDGRWWASDFYRHAVFTYDADGREEPVLEVEGQPSGLGWLPDGDLLVVSMKDRRVLRRAADGTRHRARRRLGAHDRPPQRHDRRPRRASPTRATSASTSWAAATRRPPTIVRIDPDGSASVAAEDLWFPNGMVITDDGTLIVAETFGARFTAFTIQPDGALTDRRIWAQVEPTPEPGDTETMLGAITLRARRLRARRRGAHLGGQRARRRAVPRRPRRRDRRGDRDAGRPRRLRVRARRRGRAHARRLRRARLPRGGRARRPARRCCSRPPSTSRARACREPSLALVLTYVAVRRRILLGLIVAVCALSGAWAAPRVAARSPTTRTSPRCASSSRSARPADRGVSLFVPIANWGLRAPVIGAPVKVSVEPRAVDRDAVARAVTGGGDAEVALLRQDLDRALRSLVVHTLLRHAGGRAGRRPAGDAAVAPAGVRGRRLAIAPAAAVLGVAVVLAGLGGWAALSWDPGAARAPGLLRLGRRARADPRPGARPAARGHQVLRSRELVDPLDRGPARRPLGRRDAAPRRPPPSASCSASDIHNNLLTLPTVRHYSEGHLTDPRRGLHDQRRQDRGAAAARASPRSATRSWRCRATTTRPGIMRTLERRGVTVLDHDRRRADDRRAEARRLRGPARVRRQGVPLRACAPG